LAESILFTRDCRFFPEVFSAIGCAAERRIGCVTIGAEVDLFAMAGKRRTDLEVPIWPGNASTLRLPAGKGDRQRAA
jgi:hypothetical protein